MQLKRLLTTDDLIESYAKLLQKGPRFFLNKLNLSSTARTIASFSYTENQSSNYWIIPAVKERWNKLITGDKDTSYEQYVYENYLKGKSGLKMLSPGSGISSHEMIFASFGCFNEVTCMDISRNMIRKAGEIAKSKGLGNMNFVSADFQTFNIPKDHYDLILFNSSLHHFRNLKELIPKLRSSVKTGGLVIINEYVGPRRIIYPKKQLLAINETLGRLPENYRLRYKSNIPKRRISGPGLLRMLISDPSEAVESDLILPLMRENFRILEEKESGGNIIMLLFKDIAHHFLDNSAPTRDILEEVFTAEDAFLQENQSDFIFGIYTKD